MSTTRALFMIGVAAELAGMHPQTLRMYERRGLIRPIRSRGGTRMYSLADVERLQRIQRMSEEGHNLLGIERVMELERSLESALDRVRALEQELVSQAAAATHEMDVLRRSLSTEIVHVRRPALPAPIIRPVIRRGWRGHAR